MTGRVVASADELEAGDSVVTVVDGEEVAVFNAGGEFYAVGNVCTHAGARLAEGGVRDTTVMCPRHGAEFDLRTGEPLDSPVNPASEAVGCYDVVVEDGEVRVVSE